MQRHQPPPASSQRLCLRRSRDGADLPLTGPHKAGRKRPPKGALAEVSRWVGPHCLSNLEQQASQTRLYRDVITSALWGARIFTKGGQGCAGRRAGGAACPAGTGPHWDTGPELGGSPHTQPLRVTVTS